MKKQSICVDNIYPAIVQLPEVGDTLLSYSRKLDNQLQEIIKEYNQLVDDKQQLLEEITENWSDEELVPFSKLINILKCKKIT